MEIYNQLDTPASKEFENLLNSQLSKNKIVEGFDSQNGFKIIKNHKSKKIFSAEITEFLKKKTQKGPIKIKYAK